MQDIYLLFRDADESLSILYTISQEPTYGHVPIADQFKTVYTYNYTVDGEILEYKSEDVITQITHGTLSSPIEYKVVDVTLIKEEQVQQTEYVQTGTTECLVPKYQNIDIVGVLYKRSPTLIPENYVPEPYPAPNWGVNIRLLDNEDIEPLSPYIIEPKNPIRVWA
jgi:hypothetical protein